LNNKFYASRDGVLYNKTGTTLIQYPAGRKETRYFIPTNVTGIGEGAFSGCSSLTSITLPASVTSIRNSAFFGCSSLTSISLPSNVNLADDSFGYDRALVNTITTTAERPGYIPGIMGS
jgi:hypothetical protein